MAPPNQPLTKISPELTSLDGPSVQGAPSFRDQSLTTQVALLKQQLKNMGQMNKENLEDARRAREEKNAFAVQYVGQLEGMIAEAEKVRDLLNTVSFEMREKHTCHSVYPYIDRAALHMRFLDDLKALVSETRIHAGMVGEAPDDSMFDAEK